MWDQRCKFLVLKSSEPVISSGKGCSQCDCKRCIHLRASLNIWILTSTSSIYKESKGVRCRERRKKWYVTWYFFSNYRLLTLYKNIFKFIIFWKTMYKWQLWNILRAVAIVYQGSMEHKQKHNEKKIIKQSIGRKVRRLPSTLDIESWHDLQVSKLW